MTQWLLPALYTLFVWWFSTGAILYLDQLPRSTYKWSMLWATVLLGVALAGVYVTAGDTRTSGAYVAFTAAIVVWAWKELAFLTGFLTGPRRIVCPPNARGWRRAGYALQAILWHELALLALGALVLGLTWGQPNVVATCTFATLWLMRLSAKLNVFLGVRNLNEQFLPPHLRYLGSYFRQRAMNRLFPWSLFASVAASALVWQHALGAERSTFAATSSAILATLLALGLVEHLLMMLPLDSQRLWAWGMRSSQS